jgi:Restriction endonuclease
VEPDKEQITSDNFSKFDQLHKILYELENRFIPKIENTSYDIKTDSELAAAVGNVIASMMDMIYGSAIMSFYDSLHECCYDWKLLSEEDYAKIKPVCDKWSAIKKSQEIDEQLFEDFKNDLEEWTAANPGYSDDGLTFVWFFDEKIWKPYFKEGEDKAKQLCSKLQNIIDSREGKIDFLIQSGFATISPFQFEELLAQLFTRMGYMADLTPKTGDYGIDIIARNDKDIIAIQAKKFSKGNNVGNRDVQRLLGAMQLSTVKANKAILITTSDFTIQAKEQAKETPIELWDGNYVSELFKRYGV